MKTTGADLVRGLEFLIHEARRIGENLGEEHWDKTESLDGWRNRQVLAHLAGVGSIVVPFAQGIVAAEPSRNTGEGVNIDAMNAGLVAARTDKSVPELVDELAATYTGVIDWIKAQPEAIWEQPRTFAGYQAVPMGDIFMRMIVLHGLGHIYASYSTVFNS
jgi:hypothetical protein